MARQRSGFTRQSPRRRTGWEKGPGDSPATNFLATSSVILGAGSTALLDGLTFVRIRGAFQAFLKSVSASGDGYHGALGIGIISGDAFAAPVFPDPLTESDWDGWMYHRFIDVHQGENLADGSRTPGSISFEVDSKAMRKVDETDVLFAALEVIEIGTANMDVFFDSRVLVKLS